MSLKNWYMLALATALGAAPFASGCVPNIGPTDPSGDDDDDDGDDDDDDSSDGAITITDEGNGVSVAMVDATSQEDWIFLNLAGASQVFPGDHTTAVGWDLGFRRSNVMINGGASGVGSMEITTIEGGDFDAVTEAPADGWMTDEEDANDDGVPEYAFGGDAPWYDYDFSTHILTPADRIYVVKTVADQYFKVEFLDYYDDAGTSGWVTFRWATVEAPPAPSGWTIDTGAPGTWVYLDLDAEAVVDVSDPASDDSWDIGVQGSMWRTNSGASGAGLGGARLADDPTEWDGLTSTDTVGFTVDEVIPVPGPPGSGEAEANDVLTSWYEYDPVNHTLSSLRQTYVVRTATGDYTRFRIESYSSNQYIVSVAPVEREVAIHTTVVDASDNELWTYLNLRAGEVADVTDPETDLHWDLRIRRTQLGTNSGTSGSGLGGAMDPGATDLSEVQDVPDLAWSVDDMQPLPGPPGSGEFSGNGVLGDWYDYDFISHTVTPKDKAFLVRTADGGAARIKLLSYDDGTYEVDWSYAGAGHLDFGG